MQDHARNLFVQDSWQTPRNARTLAAYMALRNQEIGARIAALRQAEGNPPQEIVAQRLNVAHRSYQAWEAGDTKPSWRNLTKLAAYFGVTEEFILVGDELEEEPKLSQLDRIEAQLDALHALMERLAGDEVVAAVQKELARARSRDAATRRRKAS